MGICRTVRGEPSPVPFRRDAGGCGRDRTVGLGVGVLGAALAQPPAREGLASSLLLSDPQLAQLEVEISRDLAQPEC